MSLVNASDLYGDLGDKYTQSRQQTTAIAASGAATSAVSGQPNASFSWLIFFLVLLAIRILEAYSPEL